MAFDSKKTILLEKTYLYVRASLGFQLEGTSTEKIPTNNGFYRFFVDNLQKSIGNSYVNILYDSQDLTLQCFCSDLYMDELMSSDSSAIEDVVAELKKNTLTIVEFENGVSSALESNHQDNVALNAKIEEFETGVSSALAANHEDNVVINTSIDSIVPLLLKLPYFSKFPLHFCYQVFEPINIDSYLFSKFNFGHLYSGRQSSDPIRNEWDEYSLYVNSINCDFNHFNNRKGTLAVGFKFPFKYKYSGFDFDDYDVVFSVYDIKNFKRLNSISMINIYDDHFFIRDQLSWKDKLDGKNQLLYFLSIPKLQLQILSTLCAFDTPSQNWYIETTSQKGDVFCLVKKQNGLIPCDLGYHSRSNYYKGWVGVSFADCNESDLDFLKKCDLYFTFESADSTSVHLYDCQPYLKNGKVLLASYPLYNAGDGFQSDKLVGMNLVYTGVSSAS